MMEVGERGTAEEGCLSVEMSEACGLAEFFCCHKTSLSDGIQKNSTDSYDLEVYSIVYGEAW